MSRKPRIFIGYSVESLTIADAINENLDHISEVTIWRTGTFNLSSNTIDSLVEKASAVDFAVFIFSPDDLIKIRDDEKKVVRDNVIFELGLFLGTIGKERCYIVKPRNVNLHLPTDLLGITTADYEPNRSDGDLTSALNYACSQIKKEVGKHGLIKNIKNIETIQTVSLSIADSLSDSDFNFLAVVLSTYTENPDGLMLWHIKNKIRVHDVRIDLASIKLEKLGYIQKENGFDDQGIGCYVYKITQNGIELLLKNEAKIITMSGLNDLPF